MDETATHVTALSENKLISRLVKIVTELDLDRRDFVIFGSGPLLAHGLRQRIQRLGRGGTEFGLAARLGIRLPRDWQPERRADGVVLGRPHPVLPWLDIG